MTTSEWTRRIGTLALPGQMVGFSVNGQRDINQNITIDGSNAIEPHKSSMAFVPSLEAIQEFKVQSAAYSAEFGGTRQGGGRAFIDTYIVAFEATSLALLVAALGAVMLAKRAVRSEGGR